jgi:hypothetical protein
VNLHTSNFGGSIRKRRRSGSVLPVVVFSLLLFFGFLAFTADVMRSAYAARKLRYAVESAALFAYSYCDRTTSTDDLQTKFYNAISKNFSPSNTSPIGPFGQDQRDLESAVTFSLNDVVLSSNPEDASENFLRLTGRREGKNALRLFFLSTLYQASKAIGAQIPQEVLQAEQRKTIEVIGQPATRIGAGSPHSCPAGTRSRELVGFAALPIAISNSQFRVASDPEQSNTRYNLDLNQKTGSAPNLFRAAFINLSATPGSSDYYNEAGSNLSYDQLLKELKYFRLIAASDELPPAAVECGSLVCAFDPNSPEFRKRTQDIAGVLKTLPLNAIYLFPIIESDPVFADRNRIIGFARLKLANVLDASGKKFQLSVDMTESMPMRNATCANGCAAFPSMQIAYFLPAEVQPFQARRFIPQNNSVERRRRSIVLAPALSPRRLPTDLIAKPR